jgi:hypothetical protein
MRAAFLYCWINTENNKLYVGSHVGHIDDGYVCSSKIMLKEYKVNPEAFTRQILAHGDEKDIRSLETAVLKSANASDSDNFYNLNNHAYPQPSGWKHSDLSKDKISKAIKGRTHTESTKKYLSRLFKQNPPNPGARSEETKKKMSITKIGNISNTGKIWVNNGAKSIMISKQEAIPNGFVRGRGCRAWSNN